MEINAKTTCSIKAVQLFTRASLFRMMKPITEVSVTLAILLFGALFSVVNIIREPYMNYLRILLVVSIVVIILEILLYFIPGKMQYKSFVKLGNPTSFITFTDNIVKMVTENERGDLHEKNEYCYNVFCKVVETNEYIFLFLTERSAFLIDKSTIENGSEEEIRAKLQSAFDKKYKFRNI